jgi:uncharacterized delta-60 repeat protein
MKTIALFVLFFICRITSAQQSGSIDLTFNANDVGYGLWDGANIKIDASVIQTDGKIIIGGAFTTYSSTWINKIARLNTDGSIDTSFNAFLPAEVQGISAIFIQPDGKILIGGNQGSNDFYLARLNADGSFDTSFNHNIIDYASVQVITMQQDGKILVGGYFGSYDSPGIQRFFPDGTLDSSFNAGGNLWVTTIAIQEDGKIIIGGPFNYYNLIEVNNIARLNTDGSLDTSFNIGTGFQIGTSHTPGANTSKIQVLENGKMLICGSFDNYNGTPAKGIIQLNADGSIDNSFNSQYNSYFRLDLKSFLRQANGKIIISGDFNETQWGAFTTRTVRLNPDGSIDTSFNVMPIEYENNEGRSYSFTSLNSQSDGQIIVGGAFTSFNGIGRNGIARINNNGSLDLSFSTGMGTGAKNSITSSCLQSDGKIIIGGDFGWYNGVVRKKLARLNSDGSVDLGFSSGVGANYSVLAVAVQTDGKILVGGSFNNYSGISRNALVRLNSDGSIDTDFIPSISSYGRVNCILIQPDGKIFAGGYFGTTRNCIRLNPDGSLDSGFTALNNSNYDVFTAILQPNGKMIIGGNFNSFNGIVRNHIARINSDGTLDVDFNPVLYSTSFVTCLSIQTDGKILVGGSSGIRGSLVRLNLDGTTDTTFTIGAGPNNIVNTMIIQPDDKIIVAGVFTRFNDTPMNYITRLNADGSLDDSFTVGLGANNIIETTIMQADGKVIIAGSFTAYDAIGRNRIARINATDTLSNVYFKSGDAVIFYPNPTENRMHFNQNIKAISVFSLEGKQFPSILKNNEVDLSHLSRGIYMIHIITENNHVLKQKLVKN